MILFSFILLIKFFFSNTPFMFQNVTGPNIKVVKVRVISASALAKKDIFGLRFVVSYRRD